MGAGRGEVFGEALVCGCRGPVAVASGTLVGEVEQDAEVVDGAAEGGEGAAGGFGGAGEGERGAALGGRDLVRIAGRRPVTEGTLASQVAQQPCQVAYLVVQDLPDRWVGTDLVGQRELVGDGVQLSAMPCSSIRWSPSDSPGVRTGRARNRYRRAAGDCFRAGGAPRA
ncbi:hypothetical protein ACWGOK_12125 [Streptomyces eurythermus]